MIHSPCLASALLRLIRSVGPHVEVDEEGNFSDDEPDSGDEDEYEDEEEGEGFEEDGKEGGEYDDDGALPRMRRLCSPSSHAPTPPPVCACVSACMDN